MSELLQKFSGGELIAVTFWAVMGLTWIIWIIAETWRRARKSELEVMLKQEMIQRGMSADDIVKVLLASKGGTKPPVRTKPPDESPTTP